MSPKCKGVAEDAEHVFSPIPNQNIINENSSIDADTNNSRNNTTKASYIIKADRNNCMISHPLYTEFSKSEGND